MKQHCHLSMILLAWIGLPALAILVGVRQHWIAGIAVAIVGVVAQVLYIRTFPHLSRWLGYGSVADEPARIPPMRGEISRVTLYTANICPFCPIIRRRLEAMGRELDFELVEMDITFRPGILAEKGIRSVPVVEANGRLLVGNATTAELAAFLSEASQTLSGKN